MAIPGALITVLWLSLAVPVAEDQAEDLKAVMARPILERGQVIRELQAYLEPRIPRMPVVTSSAEWETVADRLRDDILNRVVFRGEAARWRDMACRVEWLDAIDGGPGYSIRKLRYEAVPGLWIPALLYVPDRVDGRVPVVLNVNGHDAQGKAADYKQIRCINQAKRGMLALNVEWIGMGQLRAEGNAHGLINAIDLCGTSGVAVHYLAMSRALDLLLARPDADPTRVAVTGLSGGGWQTIFFSSLDRRVTFCDPVAGYSSFRTRIRHFSDLGDSEQTHCDLATVADYTHLTALRAPRPTLLTFNLTDNCCFAAPHALPPLLEAAWPIYEHYKKPNNLKFHVNVDPGTHNYLRENREALYQAMGDAFFPGIAADQAREIPSEEELKSIQDLAVPLPEDNLDLNRLALQLADRQVTTRTTTGRSTPEERQQRRQELAEVVRYREQPAVVTTLDETAAGTLQVSRRRMRLGEAWTVPVVEVHDRGVEASGETHIVIADRGRQAVAERASALARQGHKVLAVDPYDLGESHPAERDYLWGLMLGTVGDRPLGLQAGEVLALARWSKGRGDRRVVLTAVGPRTATIALVAAALDPGAIDALVRDRTRSSLRSWIDDRTTFQAAPEQFCFGLLERFDIPELEALVSPRPDLRDHLDPEVAR